MVLWWMTAAAQEPAPEVEPEAPAEPEPEAPIVIAPIDEVLPSAITSVDAARAEGVGGSAAEGELGELGELGGFGGLVRGKWFVRPVVGVGLHEGSGAVWLGVGGGHTWWTMEQLPIQVGGETVLRASAPVGGASGYRVDLSTSAGPWLGPVGIRIGPALRADREVWGVDRLDSAVAFGGLLDVSVDLGPLAVVAGVQPLWDLSDVRGDASGRWPAIGTDTAWRLGLAASVPLADVTVEAVDRVTPIGSVLELNLGLRLRLLSGRR